MFYVYESHQGGFYTSECRLEHEFLYCEECGDVDWEYGPFDSWVEFIEDFADEICIDQWEGGYGADVFVELIDFLTEEQIREIVISTRIRNRSCLICSHLEDLEDDSCEWCKEKSHFNLREEYAF